MAIEYGPKGLIGALTPQANTTVEPEFWVLWPNGYSMVNARMVSAAPTLPDRLVAYFRTMPEAAARFANAPVGAVAFACTGASYLVGVAEEDAAVARVSDHLGVPVVTAGTAVCDALTALGAGRIGLVSPYPPDFTRTSVDYWVERGFEVAAVASARLDDRQFHPIYSISAATASKTLAALEEADLDAVVLLGTGMPTLRTILETPFAGRAPVLSCMLALGWRAVAAVDGRAPDGADLRAWVEAADWRPRYEARYGAVVTSG
ncbi:MAG: hypothetical protein GVY28_03330 [Alphaproteobacteria bacterium]|jgi:maleate cis-trans isomerase|nr:hypothetical protein [Alphaproteobacteria bacterium]